MRNSSLIWKRTSEQRQSRRVLVFCLAVVGGLMAWGLIWGKTERATYLGVQTAMQKGGTYLRTEPASNFLMRGGEAALKPGCVYDFTYDLDFGFDQHPDRVKRVRKVVLVNC
jgi:hypothetical protein